MDNALFLQHLRAESLEEGRAYLQTHIHELSDHDTVGNMLADEALARLYSPFLSLKLAELLTYFGELTHHSPSHALGLKARGDALAQLRLYQAALTDLDASGAEFLQLADENNWAHTRISWLVAAASLGHIDDALREAARAREIFTRLDQPYWVCVIDHNTAWVYRQIGRYREAHALYARMLTIYPTVKEKSDTFIERAIAMAKSSMAINLSWLGEFDPAYRLQEEALASYYALSEMDMAINAEITLADFDYSQGYYGSSLRRYYHAQDLLAQHNITSPKMEAYLKLQIAHILVKLNRANEAQPLAYEAVTIYRQLEASSIDAMNALLDYAMVLAASSRPSEALTALNEAEELFARGGLEHHILATKLQRAQLYLQLQSYDKAYQEASNLKILFDARGLVARSTQASLIAVEALLSLAEREEETEQRTLFLQYAAALAKQAALQARRYYLQAEIYRSQFLLGRLYILQGKDSLALRRYRAAITQIERMLEDLHYDLSPSFLHTAWIVYAETVALYLRQHQPDRAFHFLERARSMALRQYLNRPYFPSISREISDETASPAHVHKPGEKQVLLLRTQEELKTWQDRYRKHSTLLTQVDTSVSNTVDQATLQAELTHCETKISELFERLYLQQATGQPVPKNRSGPLRDIPGAEEKQLRQHLAQRQLLLTYFLHKDRLLIFGLTPTQLITCEIPTGARQLHRLLPFLFAHLQPGGWPDPQQPPQQAIRQLLHKLYDLLIAPLLQQLPTPPEHLLIVPYGPLHSLPFHALYDGACFLVERFQVSYLPTSSLLAPSPHPETPPSPSPQPPLIFGYSGQGHLRYALEEATILARLLNARCYLEDEATISRLVAQAPGSPIIHLATHGHSRLDAPNFSAVTLADGRFSAIDAFSLDLQHCELVTLSGCETGLSLSGGGDEQLGLGRAFLAAGASSLVMSLWPVEDRSTSEFMQLFYHHLRQGASRVQALCSAQRSLIHDATPTHSHPYYWGAFRLVGHTAPLNLYPGK